MAKKATKRRTKKTPTQPPEPQAYDPLDLALILGSDSEPIQRLQTIDEVLSSQPALTRIAETLSNGGSITSAEMVLGMLPGVLRQWCKNGENDIEGPFRMFFLFCRQASGKARMNAEISLLLKNPSAWLDKVELTSELAKENENDPIGHIPQKPNANLNYLEVDDDDESDVPLNP